MDAFTEKLNECAKAWGIPIDVLQYDNATDTIEKLEMLLEVKKLFDGEDPERMEELEKILKVKQ